MRVMSGVCLGYSKWAYLFIQKKKIKQMGFKYNA